METQKDAVMNLVEAHRQQGRGVGEVLASLGVARATYYRWKQGAKGSFAPNRRTYPLTPEECGMIEAVKTAHPEYRHRRIQGVIQGQRTYLSASAIYGYLKSRGQVEPYDRRPAPWDAPRYEVWQKHLLWGCDWTRLSIAHVRWYLLTAIDFFSRFVVAWELVPSVNASHVTAIYRAALAMEGIAPKADRKPELRVDRGSPNTARVTREFFEILGAELSFARVHRPTDNAITERFYGTVKQEEIYLVGNYPDERSAREEIGRYIAYYHAERPHQALFNFTPAQVHQVNNKTALLNELKAMKRATRERRKEYWIHRNGGPACRPPAGRAGTGGHPEAVRPGYLDQAHSEIVACRPNAKAVLDAGTLQQANPAQNGLKPQKSDSLNSLILSH